MIELQICI